MQTLTTSVFLKLIDLKSTKCVSSFDGRYLYEIKLTPIFRQKYMDIFGRMTFHSDFEIKEKSLVTGVVSDNGHILIDKREQNKKRFG